MSHPSVFDMKVKNTTCLHGKAKIVKYKHQWISIVCFKKALSTSQPADPNLQDLHVVHLRGSVFPKWLYSSTTTRLLHPGVPVLNPTISQQVFLYATRIIHVALFYTS